jgi:hypothetical protein
MKNTILKKITSLIIGIALILGFNTGIEARYEEKHVNPYLDGYEGVINVNHFSRVTINSKNKHIKTLPTSLGIDINNIDKSSLHDTNPLDEVAIEILSDKGYSFEDIQLMDRGDYLKIKDGWLLSSRAIKAAKNIYVELKDVDLSDWTYGQFIEYCKVIDDKKYSPSQNQAKKLNKRGITLSDARYMLKDFYTYDAILNLSDAEIKEYLIGYYNLKYDYKEALEIIEYNTLLKKDERLQKAPSKVIKGAVYYTVYMPGYGEDDFHVDSKTHIGDNAFNYASGAQDIYNAIYSAPWGTMYNAANMWGTYSKANGGAHEGFDFNGPNGIDGMELNALHDGTLGQRGSSYGLVGLSYTIDGKDVRAFYMHMVDIETASSINVGDTIGTESGWAQGYEKYPKHLHLQVYHNHSQTSCNTSSNNKLESDNPYCILWGSHMWF